MNTARAVVIGVGNEYRHDDGIGIAVVDELRERDLPGVRVLVSDGEPAALLDAWTGVELAIVVDAVLCEPSTPGRIWRSIVDGLTPSAGAASSHALGIPDALRLGEALGRVPGELVVFAVEAADLDLGVGLSPPVSAALPEVIRAVLAELGRTTDPATTGV
ncbi:hydrogenase maturation protease [Amycolatopsis anabasis]|uniref:hydrogenase maturation protease n=1 Tax=Amycolatopsis anabasis TaxID=1840409 RepID=UPI00131CE022|nr:hydrogenase maturation protease [Amycolatopsis anabasis]